MEKECIACTEQIVTEEEVVELVDYLNANTDARGILIKHFDGAMENPDTEFTVDEINEHNLGIWMVLCKECARTIVEQARLAKYIE